MHSASSRATSAGVAPRSWNQTTQCRCTYRPRNARDRRAAAGPAGGRRRRRGGRGRNKGEGSGGEGARAEGDRGERNGEQRLALHHQAEQEMRSQHCNNRSVSKEQYRHAQQLHMPIAASSSATITAQK
jgi:hypothetical protein